MITVHLTLDRPLSHYTNLDIISGKVLLRVTSQSNVDSVIVKLEGEARSRLLTPPRVDTRERPRPVLEVHKLLYRTAVVFPPPNLQTLGWEDHSYTLNIGQYEYPFQFKFPFNNTCWSDNPTPKLDFGGLALALNAAPTQHVKRTLPPSLTGFPGEADITYYVKCTVNRPKFYQENARAFSYFNFLPIEPPRPAKSDGEAYARRQHQFNPDSSLYGGKKGGLFANIRKGSKDGASMDGDVKRVPPRLSVDVRLPNPAILTCNDDVPVRILVKQLSERTEQVYLQMLQIELIGYTRVRAHDVQRTESNSWVITSLSNMAQTVGSISDDVGTETEISKEYWYGRKLPNTICPTFETCNLQRWYELEVRVGLGYGFPKSGQDQLVVLPLRLPVQVYSGIKPPAALLDAMANKPTPLAQPRPSKPGLQVPSAGGPLPPGVAPSPIGPPSPNSQYGPQFPAQQGAMQPPAYNASTQAGPPGGGMDDAPPSYEDAIAADLPPVDGPRRDYMPPPTQGSFPGDEKRR